MWRQWKEDKSLTWSMTYGVIAETSGCYTEASSVTRSRSTGQIELFFFSFLLHNKKHLLTNTKNDDDKKPYSLSYTLALSGLLFAKADDAI